MAKNFHYFKFIATEWLTGDIVFEDFELQGIFINICALYWHRDGKLTIDEIEKRLKTPRISNLTDRFISVKDGYISIKFLDEQLIEAGHTSKINSINGSKGGRPKTLLPLEIKPTAKRPLSDRKAKESDTKAKESQIELEIELKQNRSKAFTPPTLELVRLYFIENGYSETSANKAYEYYNSANWHDSNGKQVKNWKQKMQGVWFKDENKTTIAQTVKIKVPEDFYTQSEYEEYCKKNNLVSQWKPMVW
jgi:hypothetical protein